MDYPSWNLLVQSEQQSYIITVSEICSKVLKTPEHQLRRKCKCRLEYNAQKIKVSFADFFSKFEQILR